MSSPTIIAPTTSNTTQPSTGINHPKTNRPLFKNIKNTNNLPTPNNSLKKNSVNNIIGNGPQSNVNNKKNGSVIGSSVSDKNNILFTPSKNSMVSTSRSFIPSNNKNNSSPVNGESFLDIAAIEIDLKRMEVFTGGISPMSSPVKNSLPIAIVDLESEQKKDDKVVAKKPSVVYSVESLLSFKAANFKRPVQIDIVENHQKEIIVPVSLPTTPYVNNNHHNHHNNNNNNNNTHHSNSHNNSQQKNSIFSPQISPFKIAYSQSSSSTNNNKNTNNIVTPTKKSNDHNSAVTTPQQMNSYYSSNNNSNSHNNKSNSKKSNPIPFSLNTPTTTTATTPKSNKKIVNNTPKSNKKLTTDVTAAFIAATNAKSSHVDEVVVSSTDASNNADDSSIVLPSPSKKASLKETDQKRLAARQRQIDIGKMTAGYKNYIAQVPKSKRKPTDPKTPNKNQVCSKRSWDGQIRIWRRLLHSYDDQSTTEFNEDDLEKEMNALELTPTKL